MIHYSNPIERLVKNKKVCLIGGAPSILGENLGEKINSHDIVVRANCHWPKLRFSFNQREHVMCEEELTEEYYMSQLGLRTDILFHGGHENEGATEEISKLIDLKAIALKSRRNKKEWDGYYEKEVCSWCEENDVQFQLIHPHIEELHSPTTGFAAIDKLLHCRVEKLFICGFDFFKKVSKNAKGMSHEPDKERRLVADMLEKDERIEVSERVLNSLI